jgi:hypothetical protein
MSFEVFTAMAAQNVALWAGTPVVMLADANVPEEHAASAFTVVVCMLRNWLGC